MNAALSDPEVRAKFQLQGAEPMWLSPSAAKTFLAAEIKKYRDIITRAGIAKIE
jgi:tripartite-type tricarboxylate transporter receptor subunit TctC